MVDDGRLRGSRREDPVSLRDVFDTCEEALGTAVSRTWTYGDIVGLSIRGRGTRITLSDGVREVQVWASGKVIAMFEKYDRGRRALPRGQGPGELRIGDALCVQVSASQIPGSSEWNLSAHLIRRPHGDEAAVHGQLYDDFKALQLEGVIGKQHRLEGMWRYDHDVEIVRGEDAAQVTKVVAISSAPSDGLVDFKKPLYWPSRRGQLRMHVEEKYVRLQGEGAAQDIATAIGSADQTADYIVVVRGGGNLAAFNDPEVARAIHRSPVPVVTALGHTANATLADFASHTSFDVPKDAGKALSRLHKQPYFRQKDAERQAEEQHRQQQRERHQRESAARRRAEDDRVSALRRELTRTQSDLERAQSNERYWRSQVNALTPTRRHKLLKFLRLAGVMVAAMLLAAITTYSVGQADGHQPRSPGSPGSHPSKAVHRGSHHGRTPGARPARKHAMR